MHIDDRYYVIYESLILSISKPLPVTSSTFFAKLTKATVICCSISGSFTLHSYSSTIVFVDFFILGGNKPRLLNPSAF
jgi:hypothetical protein